MISRSGLSEKVVALSILLFLVILIALIVGTRDHVIGTDTPQYINIFDQILSGISKRHEFGFVAFVEFFGSISKNSKFLFFMICFVVTITYLSAFSLNFGRYQNVWIAKYRGLVFCLAFLLISSWYLVSVTNAMRQGMALSFLYLSISFFFNRRYFLSVFTILIGFSFHYSLILILPFLFFLFLPWMFVFVVFLLCVPLYYFGIFKMVVELASSLLGLPLYSAINSYAGDAPRWVGFDAAFVIYTIFWPLLFYFVGRLGFYRKESLAGVNNVLKIYCVLALPYFVFGFGPYSNRYAFFCWLFLPMVQAYCLSMVKMDRLSLWFISVFIFCLSVLWFFNIFYGL